MRCSNFKTSLIIAFFTAVTFNNKAQTSPLIIDHTCTKLDQIPTECIDNAKANLHIAYGHTSHGSQITTGMTGLVSFKGSMFEWNDGGTNGALDLHDRGIAGANDLGNPDRTAWADATRNYLNDPQYSDVNVIIWSWCGQVSSATVEDINTYLNLMSGLEAEFPNVSFVYMTGHLDGSGLTGNLHTRNNQIRDYCIANNKVLYDFADIETWDPDFTYFGDKIPNDNCDYDSDGDLVRDANWAIEWQNSHIEGVDWYNCPSAHSQPLNANQKAYAAWWLWCRLAGWNPTTEIKNDSEHIPNELTLYQNYPNPFNSSTKIIFTVPQNIKGEMLEVSLIVYDGLGNQIETLVNDKKPAETYEITWYVGELPSGIYFYQLQISNFIQTKKMILLK